jgi:hypothetical protein
MSATLTFDTLKFMETLKKSGIPEKQEKYCKPKNYIFLGLANSSFCLRII